MCLCPDILERIATAARMQTITGCADDNLHHGFTPTIPDTEPPEAGLHWARRFLERYPEHVIQRQRSIEPNRKNAHDPETFTDWFCRYEALIEEKGIQPGAI